MAETKSEVRQPLTSSSGESESSEDSSDSTLTLPPAPDGGYGWVIVFAAFLISLICDGCAFSFGVLYNELLDYFGDSKSKTSWVGSLFMSVPMILGPLGSALSSKYGCRAVTIAGGIISATGFVLSSFASSIDMLCVTFGLIAGSGMSVCYVASMIMVAYYFKKKRALTTGLSVCGSGIGTFIFAPLTEYLIKEYGWRGTLLLQGGIVLNLTICGALFRPLEFSPEEKLQRAIEAFDKMSRTISKQSLPSHGRSRMDSGSEDSVTSFCHKGERRDEEFELEVLSHSQIQLPTYLNKKTADIPVELINEIRKNGTNLEQTLHRYFRSLNLPNSEVLDQNNDKEYEVLTVTNNDEVGYKPISNGTSNGHHLNGNAKTPDETDLLTSPHINGDLRPESRNVWQQNKKLPKASIHRVSSYLPLLRNDLYYRGNLMNIQGNGNHMKSSSCPELYKYSDDDEEDEDNDIFQKYPILKIFKISKPLKRFFANMFDLRILSNKLFLLFAFSNFLLYLWYDVPYVFLADNAIELGISEENASFLLSIIGIVNTIGQILYGAFGDRCGNLSLLYGISCVFAGLMMVFVPFTSSYPVLGLLGAGFGFFISANYTLQTIMLVQYLSLEKLANAYGLMLLTQGIANLVGPPIAGALYDKTGSYDVTFYAAGVFIIIAGSMLFIQPLFNCLITCDVKQLYTNKQLQDPMQDRCQEINMNGAPTSRVVLEMETVM